MLESPTGLEWTPRDNGAEANWREAERHCGELVFAGRSDWRLPTVDELAALYDAEASANCGESTCRIVAPIELSSPYLWSSSPEDSDRRFYVDFRFGTRLAPLLRPDLTRRVLCVRSDRAAH